MRYVRAYSIRNRCLYVVLIVSVLVICSNVAAQWTGPMGFQFNNPFSSLAATMVMNKAREDALAKRLGTRPSSPSKTTTRSASQPQAKPADESSLRFRPVGGYIKPRELADLLGNNQAERDQYFVLMNAVLDGFNKRVTAAGLQNDVAIALSFFFGENICIYRGMPELSDQQFVNLRNSFASALSSGGGFASATDRQKQEMYETLVIYTGLTQFFYDQGKQTNNDAIAKMSQQLAGQNLQTVTKAPPDTLNLTDNGLSVAPGDSSSTPPPSAENVAPASGGPIEIRQLALDFKENELRANQLYKGKRIVAVGKVGSVEKYLGVTVLVFDRGLLNPDTICYFSDLNQLAQLRRNQGVTVAATVRGFENNENITLVLENCSLR